MTTCSVVSTPARFARCLANFQVDELLLLKKSVQRMEELALSNDISPGDAFPAPTTDCPGGDQVGSKTESQMPERMALMAAAAADRGGEHESTGASASGGPWQSYHPHSPTPWAEQKPSKLQTLFQISITALAFLSFGGYLLCLIVQAIKSKGTTYFHPVATATTSSNGNVKRIKVYRRSKRRASPHERKPRNLLLQDYASYMNAVRGGQRWGTLT